MKILNCVAGLLILSVLPVPASGDVILDGSLGMGGAINGPEYAIEAEYGRLAGPNLFHSFSRFNVGIGETAIFNGPDSVDNVIGRVTGGDISTILGTIRSSIPNADLFLLNPAGILFGETASLDFGGSFFAGAADYLRLGDGGTFFAIPGENEILSTADPEAFGFLDTPQGKVEFLGNGDSSPFFVPDSETLAVFGGEIAIGREIGAASGTIRLGAAASPGEMGINDQTPNAIEKSGDISVSDSAFVDVSGEGSGSIYIFCGKFHVKNGGVLADTYGDEDGGMVDVRAETVLMEDGGFISADTEGNGNGANIRISATESVTFKGVDDYGYPSSIYSNTYGEDADAGRAGDIRISTKILSMQDGARIDSFSNGSGSGGNIFITAETSAAIFGWDGDGNSGGIAASSEADYGGNAGDIAIDTGNLSLADGALIDSSVSGSGKGGDISIRATGNVEFSGGDSRGQGSGIIARTAGGGADAGNGGNVRIDASEIHLRDGGWIGNTSAGGGNGGGVVLKSTGAVRFSGTDENGFASRVYTSALCEEDYAGDAGDISIEALSAMFSDGGGVTAGTDGPGAGGTVALDVSGAIVFEGVNPQGRNRDGLGSGISARSNSEEDSAGKSGDVFIKAGALTITGGALVTNSAFGGGPGGDIAIDAETVLATGNGPDGEYRQYSGIYSLAECLEEHAGNSGSVRISAAGLTIADGAEITTSSFGPGTAGDISMNAGNLQIRDNAGIYAKAEGEDEYAGNAGTITVIAENLTIGGGSEIESASYGGGRGGDVVIQSPGAVVLSGQDNFGQSSGIVTSANGEDYEAGDAGNITIDTRTISFGDGAKIVSASFGGGGAGNIAINASESTAMAGNDSDGRGSGIVVSGETDYSGDAGDISIATGSLSLSDGALIDSSSFGEGKGGNISIWATGGVIFRGFDRHGQGSGLIARTVGDFAEAGNAGNITIESGDQISFTDGAWIGNTSEGGGKGGGVSLIAAGHIVFAGTDGNGFASKVYTSSLGEADYANDAGDIRIDAQTVSFRDGGGITADTKGPGDGGSVTVRASNVNFTGGNPHGENRDGFGSGIFAESEGRMDGAGRAGDILVESGSVSVSNGALMTNSTRGRGLGGSIHIDARQSVLISGDSAGLETRGPLQSQSEFLESSGEIPRGPYASGIYSGSESEVAGAGDAGVIRISAPDISIKNGNVTTEAKNAGGGRITIESENTVYLFRSDITTSVKYGQGNGGDIDIAIPKFAVPNQSRIIARAWEGNGGNIRIETGHFVRSAHTPVDASSRLGIDGSVAIEAPDVDVSGSLTVLPSTFPDAGQWMKTPCASRTGEDTSRFVIKGKDGAPLRFDGCLGSPPLGR